MRRRFTSGIIILIAVLFPLRVAAQGAHIQPLDETSGWAISQLQLRGYLLALNPIDLPYSDGEIRRALETVDRSTLSQSERYWIALLEDDVSTLVPESDQTIVGLKAGAGIRTSNNGRLEQKRYLKSEDGVIWPFLAVQPRMTVAGFAAALGVRHDLFYEEDPDGLDSALRLYTRAEDAYVRYEARWFSAFMGRFQRNWSMHGMESVILSSNPRSYDQIGFTLGGGKLRLRSVLGELDSITGGGVFTGTAGDDSTASGSERRYLAAHRVDWRPNQSLTISLFQSVLYSGPNATVSLKYLNPLLPVIVSLNNTPKNEENNGFVGFSVWMRHHKTVSFFQMTLDDVDVVNLKEPTSFGIVGNVTLVDVLKGSSLSAGGSAIGARTYNTHQPEGQYLYLLRGLATQFNDYITLYSEAQLHAFNLLNGLTITPRIDVLWQGEQDIRSRPLPSPEEAGTILSGAVERTLRPSVKVRLQPSSLFFVAGDIGINMTENADHVSGRSRSKVLGLLEIGVRISLEQTLGLAL